MSAPFGALILSLSKEQERAGVKALRGKTLVSEDWRLGRGGSSTRLDTAFSKGADAAHTCRIALWEQRRELWRWLIEDGALVYISGRREMERDVEAAIAAIIADDAEPAFDEGQIRVEALV